MGRLVIGIRLQRGAVFDDGFRELPALHIRITAIEVLFDLRLVRLTGPEDEQ